MKHLKIYENSGNRVYTLSMKGQFLISRYTAGGSSMAIKYLVYDSYFDIFDTRKDLENYVINMVNDLYDFVMEDDGDDGVINKQMQNDYKGLMLDTYEDCREFWISFNEMYDTENETECSSGETVPMKCKIRDDVKVKIEARKYNL